MISCGKTDTDIGIVPTSRRAIDGYIGPGTRVSSGGMSATPSNAE